MPRRSTAGSRGLASRRPIDEKCAPADGIGAHRNGQRVADAQTPGRLPRQNGLALALREIGRIERALFTFDWLENPELRRQATAELNKGEARLVYQREIFWRSPISATEPVPFGRAAAVFCLS
jgi:Tn3 transposase DDE domain